MVVHPGGGSDTKRTAASDQEASLQGIEELSGRIDTSILWLDRLDDEDLRLGESREIRERNQAYVKHGPQKQR